MKNEYFKIYQSGNFEQFLHFEVVIVHHINFPGNTRFRSIVLAAKQSFANRVAASSSGWGCDPRRMRLGKRKLVWGAIIYGSDGHENDHRSENPWKVGKQIKTFPAVSKGEAELWRPLVRLQRGAEQTAEVEVDEITPTAFTATQYTPSPNGVLEG